MPPEGEIFGKTLKASLPAPIFQILDKELAIGKNYNKKLTLETELCDGCRPSFYEVNLTPIESDAGNPHLLLVLADITERKYLEEKLRKQHKMEAIGRLAGGIAHDFNNLLTVVISSVELISSDDNLTGKQKERIGDISQCAERAASLTKNLLAFSRKQILEPKTINLNETVSNLLGSLEAEVSKNVDFEFIPKENIGNVKTDVHQLQEILLNLVSNSNDAIAGDGKITITTDQDDAFDPPRVMLCVSDTGEGIPSHWHDKLFEPFFTTKEVGKGTGLGLSMAYGVMKQSGGDITVSSDVGLGTTIRLHFPTATSAKKIPKPQSTSPRNNTANQATVLLVEDEEKVLKISADALANNGYMVIEAQSGAEAIEILQKDCQKIDLILTDVIMADMSGQELAKRAKKTCPQAEIVFMSGYTSNLLVENGSMEEETDFLQKPFVPKALLNKIDRALRK